MDQLDAIISLLKSIVVSLAVLSFFGGCLVLIAWAWFVRWCKNETPDMRPWYVERKPDHPTD